MNFDFQKNSLSLKIDKTVYLRITKTALAQAKADLPEMDAALANNNWETLQAITHRWKGDFDNLRLTDLSQTAKKFNMAIKDHADKDSLLGLASELKNLLDQLEQAILSTK